LGRKDCLKERAERRKAGIPEIWQKNGVAVNKGATIPYSGRSDLFLRKKKEK